MIREYTQLKDFIRQLALQEVDIFLPNVPEDGNIDAILQNSAIDYFPSMKSRLEANARIVSHPAFESAILNIQRNKMGQLTMEEELAFKSLKTRNGFVTPTPSTTVTIVERVAKRLKSADSSSTCEYMDTSVVVLTSNMCERLFRKPC